MPWNDKTPETPNDDPFDSLEAVLGDAAWPEIEPERVLRLRRRWATIARQRTRRSWWLSAAALVGLIVSSVAVHRMTVHLARRPDPVPAAEPGPQLVKKKTQPFTPQSSPVVDSPGPLVTTDQKSVQAEGQEPESKGLNTYERLIATAVQRRVGQRRLVSSRAPADPLEAAIDQIVGDPETAITELCEPLIGQREQFERQLAQMIHRSRGKRRLAAARLLTQLATQRSVPVLTELCQWPPTRDMATVAMARLANPRTLARMALIEPQPNLQRRLMAALLRRKTPQSVRLFLNLVLHPTTSGAAIACVKDVSDPPVELLVGYLYVPQVQQRIAAARVLGQVGDPNVSQRLIGLVFNSPAGREALVALSTSQEPSAVQFVARAQLDLSLAASLRAAQHRAASFPN